MQAFQTNNDEMVAGEQQRATFLDRNKTSFSACTKVLESNKRKERRGREEEREGGYGMFIYTRRLVLTLFMKPNRAFFPRCARDRQTPAPERAGVSARAQRGRDQRY